MAQIYNLCIGFSLSVVLFLAPFSHAIEVDDYPIANEMLTSGYDDIGSQDCRSSGKAWFVNDSNNQALVISLYTDYHREKLIRFDPHGIPDIVFQSIDLYKRKTNHYERISREEEPNCLQQFLEVAARIPSNYFITKKGFTLGISTQEAIKYYGDPHNIKSTSEGKLLIWDFVGEHMLTKEKAKKYEVYAANSWGYHVKILFKKEKAIAIMMVNDFP